MRRLLPLLNILFFLTATILLYLSGRGWTIKQGEIVRTGILDIRSTPKGADIFLGADNYGKTRRVIRGLDPGTYQVTVSKEGYTPWQKQLVIAEELVTRTEVRLFSQQAIIKPLVTTNYLSYQIAPGGQTILAWQASADQQTHIDLIQTNGNVFYSTIVADDSHISWSPDARYVLFFGEPTTDNIPSTLIDTRDTTTTSLAIPNRALFLINNNSSVPHVCWDTERPRIIYSTGLELSSYDVTSQEHNSFFAADETIIPLFMTKQSNLLDKADLYVLIQEANDQRYDLWKLPDGSSTLQQITFDKIYDATTNAVLSPDHNHAVLQSASMTSVLADLNTDEPEEFIISNFSFEQASWDDENFALLFRVNDSTLAYYDLDTRQLLTILTLDQETVERAVWLPDNAHILAQLRNKDSSTRLVAMDQDGENIVTLISGGDERLTAAQHDLNPYFLFCPNQNSVLFSTYSTQYAIGTHIFSMDLR
jgi:hypothetical protein